MSAAAPSAAVGGTIDRGEIDRFDRLAAEWWDPEGEFIQLHRLNPVRIAYIRDHICAALGRDAHAVEPLAGLDAVDVGCGGGLLAEPLARLGARTTGLDASGEAIEVARRHAEQAALDIDYRHMTAEQLAASSARFDLVVASETVEHVADVPAFLGALARLTRPGGGIAMTTLNRTARSFALAILAAEYVLGWVPRGTHDWRKFLKPHELAAGLRRVGVSVEDVSGMVYDPLRARWSLSKRDLAVNYLVFGVKRG
jgi:2-polyprenyl-6-hydroxyphenyl methylase/3-demethylubiquinone-9 3-methyltransferase